MIRKGYKIKGYCAVHVYQGEDYEGVDALYVFKNEDELMEYFGLTEEQLEYLQDNLFNPDYVKGKYGSVRFLTDAKLPYKPEKEK